MTTDVCGLCGGDLGGRVCHVDCNAEWLHRTRAGICTACGKAATADGGPYCRRCVEIVPPECRATISPPYRGYPGRGPRDG